MSCKIVVVTGGAGYVGSHICKALSEAGYLPIVFDNLSTGHADLVRWGPLVEGDVRDRAALAEALIRYDASAILHLAASAYVGESITDPAKYYINNVSGTLSVLEACRTAHVDKIVLSSSCTTYGTPDRVPVRETCPQVPLSAYGRSKLACEHMVRDYGSAYGLSYVILRYFNASGADASGKLAERHDPETHLVPIALLAAARRTPCLEIFGDDYETDDGTCVRDYVHVTDLAAAHVLACKHLSAGGESIAVNLGSGRGVSVREVVAAVSRNCGVSVPVRMASRRPGDAPTLVADGSLARRLLSFVPQHSDIDTIVRTAALSFGLPVSRGSAWAKECRAGTLERQSLQP